MTPSCLFLLQAEDSLGVMSRCRRQKVMSFSLLMSSCSAGGFGLVYQPPFDSYCDSSAQPDLLGTSQTKWDLGLVSHNWLLRHQLPVHSLNPEPKVRNCDVDKTLFVGFDLTPFNLHLLFLICHPREMMTDTVAVRTGTVSVMITPPHQVDTFPLHVEESGQGSGPVHDEPGDLAHYSRSCSLGGSWTSFVRSVIYLTSALQAYVMVQTVAKGQSIPSTFLQYALVVSGGGHSP